MYFTHKKLIYLEMGIAVIGIINILSGILLRKTNRNVGIFVTIMGVAITLVMIAAIMVGLNG